jgi:hypothetical protein
MKKFARTDDASYACKELNLSFLEFTMALNTKDPVKFFKFYDPLVMQNFIKDRPYQEQLHRRDIARQLESLTPVKPAKAFPEPKPIVSQPSAAPKIKPPKPPSLSTNERSVSTSPSRPEKVRYNLMIDSDLLERLKIEAANSDRSVSSLIRLSVNNYLKNIRK